MDDDLFTYEVKIHELSYSLSVEQQMKDLDNGSLDVYERKLCYDESEKMYVEVVIFINKRLVRMIDVTVEQWLDLKYDNHTMYENLEEGELKDEALNSKVIFKGSKRVDEESSDNARTHCSPRYLMIMQEEIIIVKLIRMKDGLINVSLWETKIMTLEPSGRLNEFGVLISWNSKCVVVMLAIGIVLSSLVYLNSSFSGYHVVPPPYNGTFLPPKPDLVFTNDLNASESVANVLNVESSRNEDETEIESVPK
nr:hypothetical protein [Tanacetum cinerariifolium]